MLKKLNSIYILVTGVSVYVIPDFFNNLAK
jgi:hypothetical protein